MKIDSLEKLYVHELKDLWSAENQVVDVLPRVIEAVRDDELRKALVEHQDDTEGQIGRLNTIFDALDFGPRGHHCDGMEGLLKELKDALETDVEEVRDAMIIAAMQRVEHYEMAGYGVARTFARKLGEQDAADLLQKSLEEEGQADRDLTRIAETRINFEALVA